MLKFILIVIAVFAVYAAAENIFFLTVRRENFGGNIKIAHLSDLHKRRFGKDGRRICKKIQAEKPDLIFLTGDMVSRTEKTFDTIHYLLKGLQKIAPVYLIYGNHEQSLPPLKQRGFNSSVCSNCVMMPTNRSFELNVKGRHLYLFGLENKETTYIKNDSYRDLDGFTLEEMTDLLGPRPDGEVLLLAHNPLFAETYAQWGADYVFSGHVHGGAVRLFGVGLLSPERKFFPKYTKGVYTIGNTKLLVSAGLGKLRLFNPPELVVYSL